jgi:hypothetical protein
MTIVDLSFGEDLCRALDLDPNRVFKVTIDSPAGELPTVTVGMFIGEDEAAELVEVKTYELNPRADDEVIP